MSTLKSAVTMVVLFVVLPLLFLGIGSRAISFIIPTLIAVSVWCARSLSRESRKALWDVRPLGKHGWRIVGRFLVGALMITVATYALAPQDFMLLPRHNPRLWLAICVLYPPLSAYPQEVIYRAFFFEQSAHVLPGLRVSWLLALNVALFGFAHLVFGNIWAPILAAAGGLLFASTYLKSRSVMCAALEHALWGNLIFTIGLGPLFVGGTVANLLK
jgi:membrane protease YdiL (CAAX protease family)